MKIKCKVSFNYHSLIGKLFGLFFKEPIEKNKISIKTMLTPLDDESKTKHDVAFLIGYGDKDIYARKDDAIKTIDLTQGKTYLLYEHKTSLTDVVDFRICFPNEKSNLKLYDENDDEHIYRLKTNWGPIPRNTLTCRYYFKVHSTTEVILLIIALLSGLGAFAEVVNLLLQIV